MTLYAKMMSFQISFQQSFAFQLFKKVLFDLLISHSNVTDNDIFALFFFCHSDFSWNQICPFHVIFFLLQDFESRLVVPDPRFSIEVFFVFLTCMMVVSLVAFLFLNCWPSFRNEFADTQLIAQNEENASNANSSNWSDSNASGLQKAEFLFLLSIQCFVCFVSNGAFPSIQTYSCLPYGNAVYHLRYA